jgi:hypothetical protein
VYKEPYIFGLPTTFFFILLGCAFVVFVCVFMVQTFVGAMVGAVVLGSCYGALVYLLGKYGRHFFVRLLSYYTDHDFDFVRKNRHVKNVFKRKK